MATCAAPTTRPRAAWTCAARPSCTTSTRWSCCSPRSRSWRRAASAWRPARAPPRSATSPRCRARPTRSTGASGAEPLPSVAVGDRMASHAAAEQGALRLRAREAKARPVQHAGPDAPRGAARARAQVPVLRDGARRRVRQPGRGHAAGEHAVLGRARRHEPGGRRLPSRARVAAGAVPSGGAGRGRAAGLRRAAAAAVAVPGPRAVLPGAAGDGGLLQPVRALYASPQHGPAACTTCNRCPGSAGLHRTAASKAVRSLELRVAVCCLR